MPRNLIVATALAAAVLAGCGGSRDDQAQVRTALADFREAVGSHDYHRLCTKLLSRHLVANVESFGLPCEVALQKGLSRTRKPALQIRKIRVDGDRAFALVRTSAPGQKPSSDVIELDHEDGAWHVATLSGEGPPAPKRPTP